MTAIHRQSSRRWYLITAVLCLCVLASAMYLRSSGPKPEDSLRLMSLSGDTMGTRYEMKFVVDEQFELAPLQKLVTHELENLTAIFSTYDSNSELSQLNKSAKLQATSISARLASVLRVAQDVSRLSDGALDVTIGPLVNLWGFGPTERPHFDEIESQLPTVMKLVGNELFSVDTELSEIKKFAAGVSLDLSALAKGYAVDAMFLLLKQQRIESLMVEIGGEVRAAGKKISGAPWRVGIEKPLAGKRDIAWVLALDNRALATSGDYRHYIEHENVRYSHLLDPRTGWPVRFRNISVTVVHEEALYADAWATALTVLGHSDGLKLATRLNIAVQYVVADRVYRSQAFEELPVDVY